MKIELLKVTEVCYKEKFWIFRLGLCPQVQLHLFRCISGNRQNRKGNSDLKNISFEFDDWVENTYQKEKPKIKRT